MVKSKKNQKTLKKSKVTKKPPENSWLAIPLIVMSVITLGAMTYVLLSNRPLSTEDQLDLLVDYSFAPFSYDSSAAPDWRYGGHGSIWGPKLADGEDSCFAFIYFTPEDRLGDIEKQHFDNVVNGIEMLGTIEILDKRVENLQLTTVQGRAIPYNALILNTTNPAYSASLYGYMSVESGSLIVKGTCKTYDQVPGMIQAVSGFRFDPTLPLVAPPMSLSDLFINSL